MHPAAQPLAEVLLHGEESDAIVSATHVVVPPHNAGPPLHAHDFDEAFYVLEGRLTFQVNDAIIAKRGRIVLRFTQHASRTCQSQQRARAVPPDLHACRLRASLGANRCRAGWN